MEKRRNGSGLSVGGGYAFLFVTIFFFSTYEVVNKLIGGRIDPLQVNCIRFFVGGLILFAFAAFKRELRISARDFGWCAVAGFLNVVVSMSLFNLGLSLPGASAAVCAVAFSCNPVFVSVFAAIFDREKIRPGKIVALGLGVAGTVLVAIDKLVSFSGGGTAGGLSSILSPALACASAIAFALYTVLGRKISVRTGSLRMNAYSFLAGALILAGLLFATGRPVVGFDVSITGWVAYLAIFVTGLAYLSYFRGLTAVGAGKGSLVFFLKPVFATILAVLLLRETVGPLVAVGMALILFSIAFSMRGKP